MIKMNDMTPTWKISEKEVLTNFSFLQSEYGFPKFTKKWLKDEYSIYSRKNDLEFSCLIFMFSSGSPELGFIDHSIPLEFNDSFYPTNYYEINKLGKLDVNLKRGRENINYYVESCANLIKNNPESLDQIINELKRRN